MKKILLIYFAAFLLFNIFSQENNDQEDEIILPQMSIEIEDIGNDEIVAEFPEDDSIEAPEISVILPGLNELENPDFDLDVSFSDENDETYNAERSFFSEGVIGFGMQNHTLGEINLYTIGSDQDFNLKFAHENIDGYGLRDPGQGFFNTNTILDTGLKYNFDKHKINLFLEYMQNEEGFQNLVADYQSYTLRFVNTGAAYSYSINDSLSLNSAFIYDDFRSIITGADPVIGEEQRIHADVSMLYLSDKIDFQLKNSFVSDYAESFENYDYYYNKSTMAIEYTSFANTRLGADITVNYDEEEFDFPFTLILDSDVLYYLNIKLSAGYDVRYKNYYDLGKEFDLLFQNQELSKESLEFLEASISLNYTEEFSFNFNLRYEDVTNMLAFSETADSQYGVFSVLNEDAEVLFLDSSINWSPSSIFSMDLKHKAYLVDGYSILPEHSFIVKADISDSEDSIGTSLQSEFRTDQDFPIAGLSFFAKVSSGLIFILEANDVLYPMMDDGRFIYDEYETKGFEIVLKTQISF